VYTQSRRAFESRARRISNAARHRDALDGDVDAATKPEEGAVEVAVGVAGDDATTAERRERGDDDAGRAGRRDRDDSWGRGRRERGADAVGGARRGERGRGRGVDVAAAGAGGRGGRGRGTREREPDGGFVFAAGAATVERGERDAGGGDAGETGTGTGTVRDAEIVWDAESDAEERFGAEWEREGEAGDGRGRRRIRRAGGESTIRDAGDDTVDGDAGRGGFLGVAADERGRTLARGAGAAG
jgi:hypothetical protein